MMNAQSFVTFIPKVCRSCAIVRNSPMVAMYIFYHRSCRWLQVACMLRKVGIQFFIHTQ